MNAFAVTFAVLLVLLLAAYITFSLIYGSWWPPFEKPKAPASAPAVPLVPQ